MVNAQTEKSGEVEKIVLTKFGNTIDWLNAKAKGEIGKTVVTEFNWKALEYKDLKHFNVYLNPKNKTNIVQYYQFDMNFYDGKGNVLGKNMTYSNSIKPHIFPSVMLSTGIPYQDWSKVTRYTIKYNVTSINPDKYDYSTNAEQKSFLNKVVTIINAKDKKAYHKLIHPSYKQCSSKKYALDAQDEYIDVMLSRSIPEKYEAKKHPPKNRLKLDARLNFEYPIHPEMQLFAVFDRQDPKSLCDPKSSSTHIGEKIGPMVVKDKGHYWVTQPCLLEKNAGNARKFLLRKKQIADKVSNQRNKLTKKDRDYIIQTALKQGESKAKSLLESKYNIKDRFVRYYIYSDICQK